MTSHNVQTPAVGGAVKATMGAAASLRASLCPGVAAHQVPATAGKAVKGERVGPARRTPMRLLNTALEAKYLAVRQRRERRLRAALGEVRFAQNKVSFYERQVAAEPTMFSINALAQGLSDLSAVRATIARERRETRGEYRLRWAVNTARSEYFRDGFLYRQERRALRATFKNSFAKLALEEGKDLPFTIDDLIEIVPKAQIKRRTSTPVTWRAERSMKGRRVAPEVERVKRSFRAVMRDSIWEWDSKSHTLTPKSQQTWLERAQAKLFPRVYDAVAPLLDQEKRRAELTKWVLEQKGRRSLPRFAYQHPLIGADSVQSLVPQMEGAQADTEMKVETSSATASIETTEASVGAHVQVNTECMSDLCGDCRPIDQNSLSSRVFCFKRGEWKATDAVNSVIASVSLPDDVIIAHGDQPNFALFKQHMYWHGDMEVEVKINANCRQYGQLLAYWYYADQYDLNAGMKDNIYTNSQTMHALATANVSNTAKILIPFRYPKPNLCLKLYKDGTTIKARGLKLGTFKLQVLVPLTTINEGSQTANYSIFVRFLNSCFTGVVSRTVVHPQMFTALAAASMIKQMVGDANRDLPMQPSVSTHMKPISSDNWAAGTGQHRTAAPLRLDTRAVLPYPKGRAPEVDEMKIDFIKSIFTLFKQIDWTAQHVAETLLHTFEAEPLMAPGEYYHVNNKYSLPTIAVISSMFALWRGDMELRVDVVGTADLSGRLMVAYVPNTKDATFEQCMASNPVYVDIQENRSFTVTIPFVSDRPWRTRRYRIGEGLHPTDPIGYMYVYVVNKLIVNNTIPDKCKINLYIRGAPSFEVAIPAQPIIGIAWNTTVHTGTGYDEYHFSGGYWPTFAGAWREFQGGKRVIMRYGNVTDHVSQLEDSFKVVWVKKTAEEKKQGWLKIVLFGTDSNLKYYDNLGKVFSAKGFVPWTGGQSDFVYAVPFSDEAKAKAFAAGDESKAELYGKDSEYFWVGSDTDTGRNLRLKWEPFAPTGDPSANIIPQMDERVTSVISAETVRVVPHTGYGLSTFGESFGDFKDIIRRTSPYFVRSPMTRATGNVTSLVVPVMPQGLRLSIGTDDNPNLVWNFMRDGNTQIIASAFRFYSGSMAFKIKCVTANGAAPFFVQHRPLATLKNDIPRVMYETKNGVVVTNNDLFSHGLATYVQVEKNSQIMEVDVPYYQPATMGLLQRPNFKSLSVYDPDMIHYMSMGELAIGVLPGMEGSKISRSFSIWSAAGDDMRFSTFQGFPQMFFIADTSPFLAKPFTDTYSHKPTGFTMLSGQRTHTTSEEWSDLEPQGLLSFINNVGTTAQNCASVSSKVNSFAAQMAEVDVGNVVGEAMKDVKDGAEKTSYFSMVYGVINNIVHCLIRPAWDTISWAIVSTIGMLFNFSGTLLSKLANVYKIIATVVSKPFSKEVQPQMDLEDEEEQCFLQKHTAALISLIISGIMAYLGYNSWKGEYNNKFVDLMYKVVKAFTSTANGLLTFFKGTLECLKDMFDWCVRKISPEWDSVSFLAEHDFDLYKWVKDVQSLVDGRERSRVFSDPKKIAKLYAAANEACLVQQKILAFKGKLLGPQFHTLQRLISDILKLRDAASGMHIAPPVKFEPFVVQFSGKADIGKSHLMQNILIDMLDSINYRTWGEPIYTRAPGNPYWNGLNNQPCVVFDDFLNILSSEFSSVQISELFQLKTRVVFNPPMAAVEDKNIRYNPVIVGINSNASFWSLAGVLDMEAIHRRRDILVDVRIKAPYTKFRDVKPDDVIDYGHLDFYFVNDPRCEQSGQTGPYSYHDFRKHLFSEFQAFYAKETKKFTDYSKKIYSLTPKIGEEATEFKSHMMGESIENFYQKQAAMGTERELMMHELQYCLSALPAYKHRALRAEVTRLINSDSKKSILDHWIDAYCKEMGLETALFSKQLLEASNTCVGIDYAVRAKMVLKGESIRRILVPQMSKKSARRRASEFLKEESQPEPQAEINDGEVPSTSVSTQCDINYSASTASYASAILELPLAKELVAPKGCIHQYMEDNSPSSLSWCSDSRRWQFIGSELVHGPLDLARWNNWMSPDKIEYIEDNGLHYMTVPHIACNSSTKCPFETKPRRDRFVQRYIDSRSALTEMQKNNSDELKNLVPSCFSDVQTEKPKEEIPLGWWQWAKDKIMNSLPWAWTIKVIGIVLGAIGIIYAMCRYILPGGSEENVEAQSPHFAIGRGQKTTRKKEAVNFRLLSGVRAAPQAMVNKETDDAISGSIRRNTFFLVVKKLGVIDETISARCLGICDRYAILPNHYYDAWYKMVNDGGVEFFVDHSMYTAPVPVEWKELKFCDDGASLCFVRLPERCQSFKDIRNKFVDGVRTPQRLAGTLFEIKRNRKRVFEMIKNSLDCVYRESTHVRETGAFMAFSVPRGYEYPYAGAGVCGSVLVTNHGKIIGMHVAGSGSVLGVSTMVTQDYVAQALQYIGADTLVGDIEIDETILTEPSYDKPWTQMADAKLIHLGTVPPALTNTIGKNTSLRRSEISEDLHREFPSLQEPAVLHRFDKRIEHDSFNPLVEGVKHHGQPMVPFDAHHLKIAIADYRAKVLTNAKPHDPDVRILTELEAVAGIEGDQYIKSVDQTSSSGWPWRTSDKKDSHQKKTWLNTEEQPDGSLKIISIGDELKEVMAFKKEQRNANKVPFTVFADVLKDETLPSAKAVKKGGTRIVSMSPIDFTVQQRQYTMYFAAAFMHNRLELEHAIGINPDSSEWTRLFNKIAPGCENSIIAADYSKFGDKLPVEIGKACYGIMADWFDRYGREEEAAEVRQNLKIMAEEVFNAKHIMYDTVYQTLAGMPSGNTLTVILNSMVNSIFIRLAWLRITSNTKYVGLDKFAEHVRNFSYGDDLIIGVKDMPFFNSLSLHSFFGAYGMKFTDADKTENMTAFRSVDTMQFLKRGWKSAKDSLSISSAFTLLLAPMEENTITEVAHWITRTECRHEMSKLMTREATALAFTRGREYYDHFCARVRYIWSRRGEHMSFPTWEDLWHRTYSSGVPLLSVAVKWAKVMP